MTCSACKSKDKLIANMRGEITFHKGEQERWRALWESQRGGEVFNAVQRELAETRCELIALKNQMKQNVGSEGLT